MCPKKRHFRFHTRQKMVPIIGMLVTFRKNSLLDVFVIADHESAFKWGYLSHTVLK